MNNLVSLQHSRKAIGRAGDILIKEEYLTEEYNDALEKLSNWRASHIYPLSKIHQLLYRRARKIDKRVLMAQRLKRVPSIINKLNRFDKMKLHRIQDLGGCRAIVSDIKKVYELRDNLFRDFSNHILIKEDDYIKQIPESGYRGIHLIYKYQGNTILDFNNHLIEIQIRTKLQHAWATAVEILGTYLDESFKSSQGSQDILDFFKKVSLLFSYNEDNKSELNEKVMKVLKETIIKDIEKLDIITKLQAFSVTIKSIAQRNNSDKEAFSLLNLNTETRIVHIKYFKKDELDTAVEEYLKLERESGNIIRDNIALVSTRSVYKLQKAYPNYFADSGVFIEKLELFLI